MHEGGWLVKMVEAEPIYKRARGRPVSSNARCFCESRCQHQLQGIAAFDRCQTLPSEMVNRRAVMFGGESRKSAPAAADIQQVFATRSSSQLGKLCNFASARKARCTDCMVADNIASFGGFSGPIETGRPAHQCV